MMRTLGLALRCVIFLGLCACRDDGEPFVPGAESRSARELVSERILALAPSANLGHRGMGPNRPGNEFAENSIAAFVEAMRAGADGVELDVELTADGSLIVMHDDTLERTTTCGGCVSEWTLSDVRECRLRNGLGVPGDEPPPTLAEVYADLPEAALVNVELKVFDEPCMTETTGPAALARAAVRELHALGVLHRTLLSSFDEAALQVLREENPDVYGALLLNGIRPSAIERALELDQDAVHPLVFSRPAELAAAREAGLQVNVWGANDERQMRSVIASGATAIITDEPARLAEIRAAWP